MPWVVKTPNPRRNRDFVFLRHAARLSVYALNFMGVGGFKKVGQLDLW